MDERSRFRRPRRVLVGWVVGDEDGGLCRRSAFLACSLGMSLICALLLISSVLASSSVAIVPSHTGDAAASDTLTMTLHLVLDSVSDSIF